MNKEILWKAVKEPLRLLVLAIIPIFLVYFKGLNVEWASAIVVGLKFADQWLHEYGKANGDETLVKGITRF